MVQRVFMQIRREDLYAQIWREPMTRVASRLEVSSNYLARVCEALNVPHPPRGYWARRSAGEKLEVPTLPPANPGDPVEWVRGEALPERTQFAAVPAPAVKNSAALKPRSGRHPLVVAWQSLLEDATPDSEGRLWSRKRNILDAFVTKGTLRTAVAILNALFAELEVRGHWVRLEQGYHRPSTDPRATTPSFQYHQSRIWQPGRSTIAFVSNTPIGLSLWEPIEHVRVRRVGADRYVKIVDLPPVRRYAPQSPAEEDLMRDMATGRLVLRAYSAVYDTQWSQEWHEQLPGDLVSRVKEIVGELESAVPQLAQQAVEARHREEERRLATEAQLRAWRREERAKARAEARQKSVEDLRAIANAWKDAYALEAFFEAIGRRAEGLEPDAGAELHERIRVARAVLGTGDVVERFLRWRAPSASESEEDQSG